jgi:hypothetical protein
MSPGDADIGRPIGYLSSAQSIICLLACSAVIGLFRGLAWGTIAVAAFVPLLRIVQELWSGEFKQLW